MREKRERGREREKKKGKERVRKNDAGEEKREGQVRQCEKAAEKDKISFREGDWDLTSTSDMTLSSCCLTSDE